MQSSLRRPSWLPLVGFTALFAAIALPFPAPKAEETPAATADVCRDTNPNPALRLDVSRTADILPRLDERDEDAALEAVQVALSEVGDGSTYVWYRYGGRLSGLVQPTQSFKDVHERICRHLVITLSDSSRQRRMEGIACRLDDGVWQLEGPHPAKVPAADRDREPGLSG